MAAVRHGYLAILALAAASFARAAPPSAAAQYFLYVGSYGNAIHAYRFRVRTGALEEVPGTAAANSPSFLATDPAHRFLYATSEAGAGAVLAFRIDRSTGTLSPLNARPSGGAAPCYLAVDATGTMLVVANYGSGSVSSYAIGADGELSARRAQMTAAGHGPDKLRQAGPHAHETVFSADNRFLYVPDLGLDQIRIYRPDAAHASLAPADPAAGDALPGSGPRHLVLSRDGRFAYVVHELKSQVSVFSRNAVTGALSRLQTIATVGEGFSGASAPAEIALDAGGRHLYVSNRLCGTIAVFDVDVVGGKLVRTQIIGAPGSMPRAMALDPSGGFLFVGDQKSDKFSLYAVDRGNGRLTPTGRSFVTPSPASFQFVPAD